MVIMTTALKLQHILRKNRPKKVAARRFMRRSAVNLLIYDHPEWGLQVLMIERARCKGDPWSGHMAFPGGRMDPGDSSIRAAGLRELSEEVGIEANAEMIEIGRLSDLLTKVRRARGPMVITPIVYRVDHMLPTLHNHEVADSLWVPLAIFTDPQTRLSMKWQYRGRYIEVPYYRYQNKQIWGLSLAMLDELAALMKHRAMPHYASALGSI